MLGMDTDTISRLARLAALWSADLRLTATRDRFTIEVRTCTKRRLLASGTGPTMADAAVEALAAMTEIDAQEVAS